MGAASCCSAGRFAGSCTSTAGASSRSRSRGPSAAQTSQVQDVPSGAVTYGHRFLTTSGRAGRAIKVRTFDDYRARLLENFVILERSERHDKIARELDAKALRLKSRVSRAVHSDAGLLEEVPDLVEYPSVIAGTFASEFTEVLPDEVLTTTLIHHQHYFPVEGEDGRLKPAFLAFHREIVLIVNQRRRPRLVGQTRLPTAKVPAISRRVLNQVGNFLEESRRPCGRRGSRELSSAALWHRVRARSCGPLTSLEDHEVLEQPRPIIVEGQDFDHPAGPAAGVRKRCP